MCKHNKGIRKADFTFTSFANLPNFFFFIYPFGQLAFHSFQYFVASNSCCNSCLNNWSDNSRCRVNSYYYCSVSREMNSVGCLPERDAENMDAVDKYFIISAVA